MVYGLSCYGSMVFNHCLFLFQCFKEPKRADYKELRGRGTGDVGCSTVRAVNYSGENQSLNSGEELMAGFHDL